MSPWTMHILRLRRLQKGGYGFERNDLRLEEWLDLVLANDLIEARLRAF